VLNLTLLAVIIAAQYRTLAEIRLVGYLGMLALLASSVLAGWVVAGAGRENRKALALTTSIRNVGLGLVIVTRSFPGTPAVTATTAYGLFQTVLMALVALGWGRWTPAVEAAGPHEAVSTAAGRRLAR
jgi:BASS family bile acid:Na+ symporter